MGQSKMGYSAQKASKNNLNTMNPYPPTILNASVFKQNRESDGQAIPFPEVLPESPSPLVELEEKDPAARMNQRRLKGRGKACKMLQLKSFHADDPSQLRNLLFFKVQGRCCWESW